MIFWIIAWVSEGFRPIYYWLVYVWMIAGSLFMALPIAFWITGVVVNSDKFEGTLLWLFIVQSVMLLAHIIIHAVYIDGLALWTGH